MSIGEIAYLTLVIASFGVFMASLAFVSWYSSKKPAPKPAAQIHTLPGGVKKAA